MAGRKIRSAWCGAAVLVFAAILPGCRASAPSSPASIRITVGDAPHEFPAGTTLGDVIYGLTLRPHNGRLVSISGSVLDPAYAPGSILVNGTAAPIDVRLRSGDTVRVADGADVREGLRRTTRLLPGRHLGNPEQTLRRFKIRRTTVAGAVSGEVVAVRDTPLGRGVAHGQVALTFDDGPWPGQTRRIVAILRRFHVPATFFMIGYLVERSPGIANAVARAGMRIGDHSWDHPTDTPFADLPPDRLQAEIGRTRSVLERLGVVPLLFRPPGGSVDDGVIQAARRQGMRVVTWSVDPRDWAGVASPKRLATRVLAAVRPGSIVLLHDGGGDRSATVAALPRIIRAIRARGLHLVTVPTHA